MVDPQCASRACRFLFRVQFDPHPADWLRRCIRFFDLVTLGQYVQRAFDLAGLQNRAGVTGFAGDFKLLALFPAALAKIIGKCGIVFFGEILLSQQVLVSADQPGRFLEKTTQDLNIFGCRVHL